MRFRFCILLSKMIRLTYISIVAVMTISPSSSSPCEVLCPQEDKMVCGFDALGKKYKMFPGKCAMEGFIACSKVEYAETPISFCIKSQTPKLRRMYGEMYAEESCPVFCPKYYRPVCGASKMRDYKYRVFSNGCYLDMLNCRGEDDSGYVEVPLSYCPNHNMKNIFNEQVIVGSLLDHRDYDHDND